MGPQDVIAHYLQGDSTDGPAASAWVSAFPQVFSSTSDVPLWLTTSLKTLLGISGTDTLTRSIIATTGTTANKSTADIEIYTASYESAEKTDGWHADIEGGETANVKILCRQPRTAAPSNQSLPEILSQRVKFLINNSSRSRRGDMLNPLKTLPSGEGPGLPIPFGVGIDPTQVFFSYWVSSGAEGTAQSAIEWGNVYRCEYVRIMGTTY